MDPKVITITHRHLYVDPKVITIKHCIVCAGSSGERVYASGSIVCIVYAWFSGERVDACGSIVCIVCSGSSGERVDACGFASGESYIRRCAVC